MKIAVPWPVLKSLQQRLYEPLSRWRDPSVLLLCLAEPCSDPFLSKFDHQVMPRNTAGIGSGVPRCYVRDMLRAAMEYPGDDDWCGVGVSDIVPDNPFYQEVGQFGGIVEAVAYHALEVKDWHEVYTWEPDARRPRLLLMRRNAAKTAIWGFLPKHDLTMGAIGWAERLGGWLGRNARLVRRLTHFHHKSHVSNWDEFEPESVWNGGPLTTEEEVAAYDYGTILEANILDAVDLVPPVARHVLRAKNPDLFRIVQK